MGTEELRELLDPEVLAELELELQRLVPNRQAKHADDLHDLFVDLGPLTLDEVRAVCNCRSRSWLEGLRAERRVIEIGGRLAAAEDAGRLRDALGWAVPQGLPSVFTDPVERPLDDVVARYARTHVPFTTDELTGRFDISVERARVALTRLEHDNRVVFGEFRPAGLEREWCDTNVLRILRRRSLAALRHEIEPVDANTYARFLSAWQSVGRSRRGTDALIEALEQLQGVAIPASVLERDVLPARVDGYRPGMLDELCAAGEIVWIGAGALGADDGRVRVFFRGSRFRLPRRRRSSKAHPTARSTTRSATGSCGRARASGPISSPPPASPTTASCSPRSGISCGPARSRTTSISDRRPRRHRSQTAELGSSASRPARAPRSARRRGPLVARRPAARARALGDRERPCRRAATAGSSGSRHP